MKSKSNLYEEEEEKKEEEIESPTIVDRSKLNLDGLRPEDNEARINKSISEVDSQAYPDSRKESFNITPDKIGTHQEMIREISPQNKLEESILK